MRTNFNSKDDWKSVCCACALVPLMKGCFNVSMPLDVALAENEASKPQIILENPPEPHKASSSHIFRAEMLCVQRSGQRKGKFLDNVSSFFFLS